MRNNFCEMQRYQPFQYQKWALILIERAQPRAAKPRGMDDADAARDQRLVAFLLRMTWDFGVNLNTRL